MGNPLFPAVDSTTLLFPSTVMQALDAYNSQRAYITYGINAAANVTRDTASNVSVIAMGRGAMGAMTSAKLGIAIGRNAQGNGAKTRDNIAVGDESLRNVNSGSVDYNQADLTGTRNIGIGGNAGYFITTGYLHTVIGRNTGSCIVAGQGATAVGGNALGGYAPIGFSGVIENWAPQGTGTTRLYSTAVGSNALQYSTAPTVTAVGGDALKNSKKSDFNTAVGASALASLDVNTGYSGGTYTALNASGTYTWASTTITFGFTGHGLAVGDTAYLQLTSGGGQTFQGDVAPAVIASVPDANTFTATVGASQSASGNATLVAKETAAQASKNENNTALGSTAGTALVTATSTTVVGSKALQAATTASQTAAFGANALGTATSATNSAALGFYAAGSMTADATQVTAVGASALRNRVDGNPMTDAFTNVTGIGYDSRVSGSNQVQLGNTAATVYAQSAIQTRSDERDKAEIRDTKLGLNFIEALRPVDFKWDRREDYTEYDDQGNGIGLRERDGSQRGTRYHHGFIAQEVGKVIDELGVDFGGYQDHTVNGGDDVQSIGYEEVIAPLVKAVQELSAQVEQLKARLGD